MPSTLNNKRSAGRGSSRTNTEKRDTKPARKSPARRTAPRSTSTRAVQAETTQQETLQNRFDPIERVRQRLLAIRAELQPLQDGSRAPPQLRDAMTALRLLDEGRYGFCIDCNRDIPTARLSIKPEATRCVQCQTTHERVSNS